MLKLIFLAFLFTLSACHSDGSDFELCGMGITYPYYFTGLDYQGEIYAIEKEFQSKFKPPKNDNTGIAKIRFQVNCRGETGNFKYEEYDLNYRQTGLNDSIETQITAITKNLDQWIIGENESGKKINSYKFLSFRIYNGVITEILPR